MLLDPPPPCHKPSHLLGPPPPSSVTYFMDGPQLNKKLFPNLLAHQPKQFGYQQKTKPERLWTTQWMRKNVVLAPTCYSAYERNPSSIEDEKAQDHSLAYMP